MEFEAAIKDEFGKTLIGELLIIHRPKPGAHNTDSEDCFCAPVKLRKLPGQSVEDILRRVRQEPGN